MIIETVEETIELKYAVSNDRKIKKVLTDENRDKIKEEIKEYNQSTRCIINQKWNDIKKARFLLDDSFATDFYLGCCESCESVGYVLDCQSKEMLEDIITWGASQYTDAPLIEVFSKKDPLIMQCHRIGSLNNKINHGNNENPDYEELTVDYDLYVGHRIVVVELYDYCVHILPYDKIKEIKAKKVENFLSQLD